MEFPLLQDLVTLLGFSVVVVFIFQRLRLPSILGFLATGIIIGPYGLSLVKAVHEVETISEIGVILLLFVIGMELSIKQLISMRKTVFIGGLLQVGLSILVTALVFKLGGLEWNESVFIGFLVSLSSTAIVLKLLQDRNEISSPHGRNALGILIFQDIIVVPMMLVTPIMAGNTTNVWMSVLELVLKSGLVLLVTFVSARYLVPRLMHLVARTKSKELFLLTTITLCFAVTLLTSVAGLSLGLGAFLAGLIVSESEYSHQATSSILPFRELFTSFFFISVGMLLNISFFINNILVVLLIVLVVFVLKGTLAAIAAAFLKYPHRTVLLTGLVLFQVGEFAFILSKVGIENGLLSEEMNQYFLAASIVTMMLTPFVLMLSGRFTQFFARLGMSMTEGSTKALNEQAQAAEMTAGLENHLVIIGYGINGRNVAKAARYADIPYIIIELNADTVRQERANGEKILYGDAVHEHILHEVRLSKARAVVVAISDPQATKMVVSNVRELSHTAYLLVRTRYVKDIDELLNLGADEVIPEEFETSIEIFSRILNNYLVSVDELEDLVQRIRNDNYDMFRPQRDLKKGISPVGIPELKIMALRVMADSGEVVGKTIAEAGIRRKFGVNILAIHRDSGIVQQVLPDEKILHRDKLYVSGEQDAIEKFYQVIN